VSDPETRLVQVFDPEADALRIRDDNLPGRTREARVDENRTLPADEQVLAHEALTEIRLDAVYPWKYLHPPPKTHVAPH
jgi:hypothetical protein